MSIKTLRDMVDKALLKLYINSNEEVAAETYAMTKKEKILKKHVTSVYPIKKTKKAY